MEAESYADNEIASFIESNFIPLGAHIKEHPAWFKRFDANWTPTIVIMDSDGKERYRIEGYLPKQEFRAQLEMGLARLAFMHKKLDDAERRYASIVENYPNTAIAPEALYWRDVSKYSQSHDPAPLKSVSRELRERFPNSIWTKKATVWGAQESGQHEAAPSEGRV